MQLLPTQLEANCIQTSKNAEEADSFQDFSASTSMNQSDLPHIRTHRQHEVSAKTDQEESEHEATKRS